MDGQNKDNTHFISFPDVASRERHHDYRTTGFCCERAMILHKVEEKAPTFYSRSVEFRWLLLTEAPQMPILHRWGSSMLSSFRVDIVLNATTIDEVLKVREVPNLFFQEKLREMELEWPRILLLISQDKINLLGYRRGYH